MLKVKKTKVDSSSKWLRKPTKVFLKEGKHQVYKVHQARRTIAEKSTQVAISRKVELEVRQIKLASCRLESVGYHTPCFRLDVFLSASVLDKIDRYRSSGPIGSEVDPLLATHATLTLRTEDRVLPSEMWGIVLIRITRESYTQAKAPNQNRRRSVVRRTKKRQSRSIDAWREELSAHEEGQHPDGGNHRRTRGLRTGLWGRGPRIRAAPRSDGR